MRFRKTLLLGAMAATIALCAICLWAGYRAGLAALDDPAAMADSFQRGKATLCELHEDARLYACPAMRVAMPLPKGLALVYMCDANGETGFVSFVRTPPDVRAMAIGKLLEAGLRAGPHCADDAEDIVWIRAGKGRDA